jgi:DNA processing protein
VTVPYISHALSEQEKIHLLRLARTENVGPISFFHLLKRYGDGQSALTRMAEVTRRSPPKIPSLDDIKREIEEHEKRGLCLVSYYDSQYPLALKNLKDAPPFLSFSGRIELLNQVCFSIVGSRNASQAGLRLATQFAEQISHRKWVTVSGLARGVDGCVHKASVDTAGTVAVVAGGIGHVYPPEHKKLYQEIAEKGVLISEDPLNQPPYGALFPKRNRLISGLSWGVLIIEASVRSGSLLTARYASDQGRTVFACPGHPLDFRAQGTNRLIKQGASLTESVDDIFSEYTSSVRYMAEPLEDDYDAYPVVENVDRNVCQTIYESLTIAPVLVSELSMTLKLSPALVRACLVDMELNGEIERYPGDMVLRSQ